MAVSDIEAAGSEVTVDSLSAPSIAKSNIVNVPSAASVGNANVPLQIPSKVVRDWRVSAIVPTLLNAGAGPCTLAVTLDAPLSASETVTSTIHVLIITPVILYLMKTRALRRGTLRA